MNQRKITKTRDIMPTKKLSFFVTELEIFKKHTQEIFGQSFVCLLMKKNQVPADRQVYKICHYFLNTQYNIICLPYLNKIYSTDIAFPPSLKKNSFPSLSLPLPLAIIIHTLKRLILLHFSMYFDTKFREFVIHFCMIPVILFQPNDGYCGI